MMRAKLTVVLLFVVVAVSGCTNLGDKASEAKMSSEETSDIKRGRYLVEIMGCNDCHTFDSMAGGSNVPEDDWLVGGSRGFYGSWGTVYPANLRLLLNSLTEEEWLAIAKKMRRDSPMAWSWLPKANDSDLLAIYRFVKYLGPKGSPAPAPLPPGVTPTTDYISLPLPH